MRVRAVTSGGPESPSAVSGWSADGLRASDRAISWQAHSALETPWPCERRGHFRLESRPAPTRDRAGVMERSCAPPGSRRPQGRCARVGGISLTLRIQNPECGRPCACVPRAGSGGPSYDCRARPRVCPGRECGRPVSGGSDRCRRPAAAKQAGASPCPASAQQRVEPLRRPVAQIISREPSLSPRRAVTRDNAQAGSPKWGALPGRAGCAGGCGAGGH